MVLSLGAPILPFTKHACDLAPGSAYFSGPQCGKLYVGWITNVTTKCTIKLHSEASWPAFFFNVTA